MNTQDDILISEFGHPQIAIFCVRCGYELRGLHIDSVCPECALSIRESLQRRRLGLSSSAYLSSLRTGSLFAIAGLGIFIAAGFASWRILAAMFSIGSQSVFSLFDLGGAVILLVGVWMLTIDDPGLHERDQARANKRAMRAAAIGFIVLDLLLLLGWMRVPIAPTHNLGPRPLLAVLLSTGGALVELGLWLILATGLVNYARWLAVRASEQKLFGFAATFNWLLPCTLVIAFVASIVFGGATRLFPLGMMVILLLSIRPCLRADGASNRAAVQ